MKQKIRQLLKDKLIFQTTKIFIGLLAVYIIISIWKWKELPPQIPLFYSLPRSLEQLTNPLIFLLLPFFSLVFFCINFIFAAFFYGEEKLASVLLVITGTIVSFLLLISFIKIIFLIT